MNTASKLRKNIRAVDVYVQEHHLTLKGLFARAYEMYEPDATPEEMCRSIEMYQFGSNELLGGYRVVGDFFPAPLMRYLNELPSVKQAPKRCRKLAFCRRFRYI